MSIIEVSRNQLAELRGCSAATVSRHQLEKTRSGKYNLLDPNVWDFATSPAIDNALNKYKHTLEGMQEENPFDDLDDKWKKTQIKWKNKQSRKLDLEHEKEKDNLIPVSLIGIFIGYFSSGINTNFLTIGNRIARGDTRLKDRIDKAISKAIKKTLETAGKELKKESEQIIKFMEGEG